MTTMSNHQDILEAMLNSINMSGNHLKVNDETITIAEPTSITDTLPLAFDADTEDDVSIRYQTTLIQSVGGIEKLADAAYTYSSQGKVVVLTELDSIEYSSSSDSIFNQSLLRFVLQSTTLTEESARVHVKDLPIFLDQSAKYIPARNVDVIAIYYENYGAMGQAYKRNLMLDIVEMCSSYDFVVCDDNSGMGSRVTDYIRERPGVVRCLLHQ